MRKLTDGQRANAYELLSPRLVRYHGGDAKGCRGQVGSRTKEGVTYDVEIGTDSKGLYWRCSCPRGAFQPSEWCSHAAALFLVWSAIKHKQSNPLTSEDKAAYNETT